MDTKDLLVQAYSKFELNDFAGARDDYRRAIMLEEPTGETISNFDLADQLEKLEFFKNIRSTYPQSNVAWFSLAHLLAESHFKSQAIECYSEMLNLFDNNSEDSLIISLSRLGVACRDTVDIRTKLIVSDFQSIWMTGEHYEPARKLRRTILKMLINELHTEEAIPIFDKLILDEHLPSEIKTLFEAKIAELRLLAKSIDCL